MKADRVVENAETTTHDWIMACAEELKAEGESAPAVALDPVNLPQIHTWLDAIGDPNPLYRDTPEAQRRHGGPVAPPAMAQVWTMPGLDPRRRAEGAPLYAMMERLDEAGFTSVLGTNCDQTYERYLRPGERVTLTAALESVVGPKRTGVGEGYFVTTRNIWRVGDEQVATMLFRVLKFKPGTGRPTVDRTRTVRPVVNRDTAFFWEGAAAGELRIQRCNACQQLRHPPGPLCPSCGAADRGWVLSSGRGTVYSYVVHHAPQVPGKQLPLLLGLVELEEGVRMVGELRVPHETVVIGMPVEIGFDRIDDELTLPFWRVADSDPAGHRAPERESEASSGVHDPASPGDAGLLPAWQWPITRTGVVATALATRDFQDVHHDHELAVGHGSKDIFLNILTTTGLVQRYVGEWAGPAAQVRACELRLGAPAYPGDTLAFTGRVAEETEAAGERRLVVEVMGTVSLGAHVTARVTVVLPPAQEQR